jgi:G6PDH family F420-dependent oxidoreductase
VSFRGDHYVVDSARIWDLPDRRVPIGLAVSGKQSCELFAPLAEVMVGIDPEPELATWWDGAAREVGARKVAQLPISWDRDVDAAKQRAHQLFRWSAGGWKVNAELPSPAAFDSASAAVTPDLLAETIPCGADVGAVVQAAQQFFDAGYTDLALVQIGDDAQDSFFVAAQSEILPELRKLGD